MILDKLVAATKARLARQKQQKPLEMVKRDALTLPTDKNFPFEQALKQQDINFICEVKKASPSKGIIAENFPYLDIAREYEAAGASAIYQLVDKWLHTVKHRGFKVPYFNHYPGKRHLGYDKGGISVLVFP